VIATLPPAPIEHKVDEITFGGTFSATENKDYN
jgi:hypothetical protein